MSLQIEILPDLASAERRLSEFVRARPSPLMRVNLLFGSALQRVDAQRRLADEFGGGLASVHGYTPVDLAEAAVQRGQAPPRRGRPRGGEIAAVRELLERLQLSRFDPDAPGLSSALLRSFTDLREAALTPDDLPDGDLRRAFADWRELMGEIGDRTAIYEDAVSEATDRAAFREALGDAPLIVTGVSDLTRIQRLLLHRCSEAVDVRMLLVDPAGSDVDPSIPRTTASWLEGDAGAEIARSRIADESLVDTSCFSAADPVSEAEEIARRILELGRDGVPFDRVAVLHQQGSAADERIAAALARAAIPVWRIGGEPVARSAPGRAARDLLRILLTDGEQLERVSLIDALAQPGLADPLTIGDAEVVRRPEQWERVADAAGLIRGWQAMQGQLGQWLDANRERAGAAEGLSIVIADLASRAERVSQARSWSEAGTVLADTLSTYLRHDSADGGEPSQSSREMTVEVVWRLSELDQHALDYRPNIALSATLRALDGAVLRDRNRLIGGVNVGAANGPARGIRYDAVFVAGCAERVFPAPGRQDPLLPDELRAAINRRVPGALPLQSERAASDRHVFRLLRQAARRRFTASWARRTSAIGGPSRASSLLLEAAAEPVNAEDRPAALESEQELIDRGRLLRLPSGVSGVTPRTEQVESGDWTPVLRALDERELRVALLSAPGVRLGSLLPTLWPSAEFAIHATQSRNEPYFTEFDGQLRMPPDWDPLSREWSASALEMYVRCPYRFFLSEMLGVESVSERSDTGGVSRGRLIIRTLRRWESEWLRESSEAQRPTWLEFTSDGDRLVALAGRILSDARARGLLGPDAVADQVEQEIADDLDQVRRREVADARDGWRPVEILRPYEDASLGIGGGRSLRLRGQLERIDSHADGRLRAVRYEAGSLDPGIEGFRNGRVLDPVADLSALLPRLRQEGVGIDRAEVVLRSVSADGEFASQTLRGSDFTRRGSPSAPAAADDLIQTFGTIIDGIGVGSFIANVGHPLARRPNCRRCPYEPACTPDIGARIERKSTQDQERVRALSILRRKRAGT